MHIIDRFWKKVKKSDSCWEWQGCYSDYGHGRFRIHKNAEERAHRFSWQLVNGEIPKDKIICHKCDNPKCVNPDHLFLGTPKDNTQDMLSKRREVRGSQASWSKLTPQQVIEILADKRFQREIAKDYGICQQAVSDIKRRINWKIII